MTGLKMKQIILDPIGPIWSRQNRATYQLEPWPETCEFTYYDIAAGPIEIGQTFWMNFANGSAQYRVAKDRNGCGCDFDCELLPGSTWKPPPAKVLK